MAITNIFLDTAYAVALAIRSDKHHEKARALAERIETEQIQLVTTAGVILEIGNTLGKARFRGAAVTLLDSLYVIQTLSHPSVNRVARPSNQFVSSTP